MNPKAIDKFKKTFPLSQLKLDEPLAPHTTLKIGGPADLFFTAKTEDQLVKAVRLAQILKINYLILGWGSNLLISDAGYRGLVINNLTSDIRILKSPPPKSPKHPKTTQSEPARHEHANHHGKTYQPFSDLDYDESHIPAQLVHVSSGVPFPHLINWTLDHHLTGLQWFSRIPGTLGGAIFNNIHGGSHFFEEFLHQVTVLNPEGKLKTLTPNQLGVGYDRSRFQKSGETILNATLHLYQGNVAKAKQVVRQWAQRKSHQPANSAGCTFKNITHDQMNSLNYPTTGAGYIIEHILKWSGKRLGGAIISPQHHNFIINSGNATARDVLQLIKEIKFEVLKKTGLTLEPEIFFIGFTPKQLRGVVGPPLL